MSETEFFRPAAVIELTAPALTASVVVAHRTAYHHAPTRIVRDYLRSTFAGEVPAQQSVG